jgi:hypothetical protein
MGETDEIIIALRNALERGQGINSAKQSMINAGYSESSVNNAANIFLSGQINPEMQQQAQSKPSILTSKSDVQLAKQPIAKPVIIPGKKEDNTIKQLPQYNSEQKETAPPLPISEKPMNMKIFIILIILVLVVGGYVAYQLSQDPQFFQNLLAKLKK